MRNLTGFQKVASILAVPVIIIGLMVHHTIKMKRIDEALSIEYRLIESKESINDVIISVFDPVGFRENPYAKYIVLSNGQKRTLIADKDEYQRTISDVIRVGTLLNKQKYSDTVYLVNTVYLDTISYHFKILNSDFE